MSEFVIECWYDFDDGWIAGEYREEIVRCMDCANLTTSYPMWACGKLGIYLGLVKDKPYGFCAWGERNGE